MQVIYVVKLKVLVDVFGNINTKSMSNEKKNQDDKIKDGDKYDLMDENGYFGDAVARAVEIFKKHFPKKPQNSKLLKYNYLNPIELNSTIFIINQINMQLFLL